MPNVYSMPVYAEPGCGMIFSYTVKMYLCLKHLLITLIKSRVANSQAGEDRLDFQGERGTQGKDLRCG